MERSFIVMYSTPDGALHYAQFNEAGPAFLFAIFVEISAEMKGCRIERILECFEMNR